MFFTESRKFFEDITPIRGYFNSDYKIQEKKVNLSISP